MKNDFKKLSKFITSRMFYVILGLFFALAIYTVQAVWSDTVSSGQTLTNTLWNDIVAKLVDLDNKVNLKQNTCQWIDAHCMSGHYCGTENLWTGLCPVGYYMAGFRLYTWNELGTYNHQIYCCRSNE